MANFFSTGPELSAPYAPALAGGEREVRAVDEVRVLAEDGEESGEFVGRLVLTDRRLLWCNTQVVGELSFESMLMEPPKMVRSVAGFFGIAAKAVLIRIHGRGLTGGMQLAFLKGGRDEMHDALLKQLSQHRLQGQASSVETPRGRPRRALEDDEEELEREGTDGRLRRRVTVYENERKPLLGARDGSDRGFHPDSLIPTERPQWSDSEGAPRPAVGGGLEGGGGGGDDGALLPSAGDVCWVWEEGSAWQVLTEQDRTDEEGWEYAWNWDRDVLFRPVEWTSFICETVGRRSWVRRRRWFRRAVGTPRGMSGSKGSPTVGRFEDVMPLLKRKAVSVEWLEANAGGPAKADWMWKEGRMVTNWARRYWVLWPREADPFLGRLLFYFKATDSTSHQGVIHVPGIQVRVPKTLRPKYVARRLQCNLVVDVTESGQVVAEPRKMIVGLEKEKEQQLKEWEKILRAGAQVGAPFSHHLRRTQSDPPPPLLPPPPFRTDCAGLVGVLVYRCAPVLTCGRHVHRCSPPLRAQAAAAESTEPDSQGWLLRKATDGIAWWKLRWFELRGTTLLYWNSEKNDVAVRRWHFLGGLCRPRESRTVISEHTVVSVPCIKQG
jgi:hypothetical protein